MVLFLCAHEIWNRLDSSLIVYQASMLHLQLRRHVVGTCFQGMTVVLMLPPLDSRFAVPWSHRAGCRCRWHSGKHKGRVISTLGMGLSSRDGGLAISSAHRPLADASVA